MRGQISAAVFDAYGTLFDVHAAAARNADVLGADRERLSATWRQKQLEYTWLRSLMGKYASFWQITEEALDFALEEVGRTDAELRSQLLEVYRRLDPYPDVPGTLQALRDGGLKTAILSNGTADMLEEAVGSAQLGPLLDQVLSVDALRVYKPDPRVYALAPAALEVPKDQIAFMTSNSWDAAGAAAFGLRVVWINRLGSPRERLPAGPEAVLDSLAALPAQLLEAT